MESTIFLTGSGLEKQFWFGKHPSSHPLPSDLWSTGPLCRFPDFPVQRQVQHCVKQHFLSLLLIKTEPSVGKSVFPETNRGVWRCHPCFATCQLRLPLGCMVCLMRGYSVLYPVLPQNSPAWASARANGEGGGVCSCLSQLEGHRRAIIPIQARLNVFCFSSE